MKFLKAHAFFCALVVTLSSTTFGAEEHPFDKLTKYAPSIYLMYNAPDVLPQTKVTTLVIQPGLEIHIDKAALDDQARAALDKKTTWAIIDLPIGAHDISANPRGAPEYYKPSEDPNMISDIIGLFDSKETKEKRAAQKRDPGQLNVFRQTISGLPGQIYVLTYESRFSSSKTTITTSYLVHLGENQNARLRALIDTHRQQYKKQLAEMPAMSMSHNEADWGKKRASIPIKNQTAQPEGINACMEKALNGVYWKKEFAGDNIIIASAETKPLHRGGIYMKYNGSAVDIYGDEVTDEWLKIISAKITAGLQFSDPKNTRRFSIDCPKEEWGTKFSSLTLDGTMTPSDVKNYIISAMKTHGWAIEADNENLVIGSITKGANKTPLYVQFDEKQIDFYSSQQIKRWIENVKARFLVLTKSPKK